MIHQNLTGIKLFCVVMQFIANRTESTTFYGRIHCIPSLTPAPVRRAPDSIADLFVFLATRVATIRTYPQCHEDQYYNGWQNDKSNQPSCAHIHPFYSIIIQTKLPTGG
jgi:hypothetical protein